jgi:GTP-binding protein EngB required for normal cell division
MSIIFPYENQISPKNDFGLDFMVKNILIVGETGSGKSTLGNILSGRDVFETYGSMTESTREADLHKVDEYQIVDTVGFATPHGDDIAQDEADRVAKLLGGEIHICILLVQVDKKFTTEALRALESVERAYGPDIWDKTVVVFTHCGQLVMKAFSEVYENDNVPLRNIVAGRTPLQLVEQHRYIEEKCLDIILPPERAGTNMERLKEITEKCRYHFLFPLYPTDEDDDVREYIESRLLRLFFD